MGDFKDVTKCVLESHLAKREELLGCSATAIQKIEVEFKLKLPKCYVDFLLTMGCEAGCFMRGSSIFHPEVYELRQGATELLAAGSCKFQLAQNDFVFYMHQGYQFAYFSMDEGDDPAVWFFLEGWEQPKKQWESLSDFFISFVEFERSVHHSK